MVRRILRVGRVGASEPELITLGVLRQTPHARLAALVAVSVSVRDSSCSGRLAGVRCSGGAKALSACTWECAGGLFSGLDGATGGTGATWRSARDPGIAGVCSRLLMLAGRASAVRSTRGDYARRFSTL